LSYDEYRLDNNNHKLVTPNVIEEAMDVTKETPAEVSRVALRLPLFYAEESEV
jgi:hypothetical protein